MASKDTSWRWILLTPILFFAILLLSWFNSDNKYMWAMWLTLKLPFLILPLAFILMEDFSSSFIRHVLKIFVWVMIGSMIIVFIRYALHYEQINVSLSAGGRMPVPYSHIRYSLLLTVACFVSVWFYWTGKHKFYLFSTLFFFGSLHLISVRSGLLALYAGLSFVLVYFVVVQKQWKFGLVGIVAAVLISFAAYKTIPSLQNRIAFMRYDFGQWKEGNIDGNSDAMRLASIVTGYHLWQKNVWLGVGSGDILNESKQLEQSLFPNIHDETSLKMPHNEILWTACVLGVLGVVLFFVAWLLPLFVFAHQLHWLYVAIQLVFFVSFMVEYTIEEQIGGTFFVLFQLLFYKWFSLEKWNPSRL
jgi:O-antigen ligase